MLTVFFFLGAGGGVEKAENKMTLNSLQCEYNLSIALSFLYLGGGWRKTTGARIRNVFLEDCIM